jgi:hypothetical protein
MMQKMHISRSVLSALVLSMFFISGLTGPTVSIATEEVSSGEADFSSLQKCMSDSDASLNIVYIMDNSGSMKTSDPENARGPMMQSTLRILHQLGEDLDTPVQYVMVPFGGRKQEDTAIDQNWQKLSDVDGEAQTLYDQAVMKDGDGTDWKSGLSIAKSKIEQQMTKDPNSCFVAIWLTDGVIDMNFGGEGWDSKTGAAFREICESDDLINWFRNPSNEVSLLAALLNVPPEEDPKKSSKQVTFENSHVLFRSVVEGRAVIPPDVAKLFELSIDEFSVYTCGDVSSRTQKGFLVESDNAGDLSWQFVDLVASLTDLKLQVEGKGPTADFYVPELIGKIRFYVKGDSQGMPEVFDAQGTDVCSLPGACRQTSTYSESGFEIWEVDVPKTGTVGGGWSIQKLPNGSEYKVFVGLNGVYKNLTLQPSYTPALQEGVSLTEGETISAQYTLIDSYGSALDLIEFDAVEICLQAPVIDCQPKTATSFASFAVSSENRSIAATATVRLKNLDEDFVLASSQKISVEPDTRFAKIECKEICDLEPLPNQKGPSESLLPAKGGDADSIVEIVGIKVFDNDLVRAEGYEITPTEEVSVGAGESKDIKVVFTNDRVKKPESGLEGVVVYTVTSGAKKVTKTAPVTFSINQDKNLGKLIGIYVIALLIAVGLPYLALLLQARRSAVFIDDEFKYIAVPVMISKSGELLSKKDSKLEDSFQSEVPDSANSNAGFEPFVAPSFKGLSGIIQIPKGAKSIQIDKATLKVEAARFDAFAPIKVTLSVPDSIVFSLAGKAAGELQKIESTADQSLSDLVFLYSNISTIEPIDSKTFVETQSNDDSFDSSDGAMSFATARAVSNQAFEGTLVIVIAGMKNEPQVLGKLATALRSRSFEKFNTDLLALREQALLIEEELAAKSQSESKDVNPAASSSNTSAIRQSFDDDFDDLGSTSFSDRTNQSSSDDDDF